jgi:FAD synthetase
MKKVMVFGSFDTLHPGHLYFLSEAKKQGDELIVVLARDQTINLLKKKSPRYTEQERKLHLHTTGLPDRIVLGKLKDRHKVIVEHQPDIICLGYDQHSFDAELEAELRKRGLHPRIMRIGPYKEHIFKSSRLKGQQE